MTRSGARIDSAVRAGLAACSVLRDADGAALDRAASGSRIRVLDPHVALFRLGEVGEAMYVVTAGQVVARLPSESGEMLDLARAGPGALIGYLDVVDGGRRSSDAVAAEQGACVVVVPAPVALALLRSDPGAALAVARDLTGIVRSALHLVAALAFLPTRQRVAALLLEGLNGTDTEAIGASGTVHFDGSQEQVAQRLGMARQTFNRVLHDLVAAGVVTVEAGGRSVRILNRPRLRAVAAGSAVGPASPASSLQRGTDRLSPR